MEGKLHVEIEMDGRRVVARLDGDGLSLIAAALRCVNMFYTAFERDGKGDIFKAIFMDYLNEKNSMIWRTDIEAEKKENEG